ncbi:hypothetical protein [Brunnivagina elsteri]|uniref:hypothetical protein n=1 Tax=Brunnivagina elsteri TaxID=1247191 RepID=UPI000BAE3D7E|nr:hypothetical protein [Calothrix elsteri]
MIVLEYISTGKLPYFQGAERDEPSGCPYRNREQGRDDSMSRLYGIRDEISQYLMHHTEYPQIYQGD